MLKAKHLVTEFDNADAVTLSFEHLASENAKGTARHASPSLGNCRFNNGNDTKE